MRSALISLLLVLSASAQEPAGAVVAGPMLGHVSHEEASVWLRVRGATTRLRYWNTAAPEKKLETVEFSGYADEIEYPIHVPLIGLAPGTTYEYRVLLDGNPVDLGRTLRFKTQPHWRHRGDAPDFAVAIGSCAFINDPPYDRPGKPYGGDPQIFERIADAAPDLMLWLGDNLYFREPDWTSRSGMMRRYTTNRSTPALQRLLSATHHYAIWDDHDFGPNNSDRSYPLKDLALEAFREHWANPPRSGEAATGGIYTRFTWSDVEFFLLDNRYFRSPNREPDGPDKMMFGGEQLQWLLDGLTSSIATFKIVAGGNQLMNRMTLYEGWGAYPDERRYFLNELERRRIEGVVFLSGDRHHTELIKLKRSGSYPLYDYTSSPLLSSVHESKREADNADRVDGTWVHDQRNFGMLRVTGPRSDRKLVMEARGEDGGVIWTHEIERDELRYPRKR